MGDSNKPSVWTVSFAARGAVFSHNHTPGIYGGRLQIVVLAKVCFLRNYHKALSSRSANSSAFPLYSWTRIRGSFFRNALTQRAKCRMPSDSAARFGWHHRRSHLTHGTPPPFCLPYPKCPPLFFKRASPLICQMDAEAARVNGLFPRPPGLLAAPAARVILPSRAAFKKHRSTLIPI